MTIITIISCTLLEIAHAKAEYVTLDKVIDSDKAIITREDETKHLLDLGIGSLSLEFHEGKRVIMNSPGMFGGAGSEVILPDERGSCRVWDCEEIN